MNQVLRSRRSPAHRRRAASLEDCLPRFDEAGHLDRVGLDYGRAARAEDLVERRELAKRMHEAVARLPESYRWAVVLHDLEGLTGTEVVQILDIEPATLRTHPHRGHLMLRGFLGRLAGGEG